MNSIDKGRGANMTRHQFTRTMSRLPIALGVFAALAFGAYFGAQDLGRSVLGSPTASEPAWAQEGHAAADLMEQYGCWNGPAPADMKGETPGHVVVTLPDGKTVLGGEKLVAKALGQVFAGETHGLTVYGFCR